MHSGSGCIKNQEDSKEIIQEVFLKIWEIRDELNEDQSFKSLLFTIAYNKIISKFRKKNITRKHLDLITETITKETNETSEKIEFDDFEEIANKIIETLPAKRKQIFLMSRIEGYSNQEIAYKLKISKNTVENQITTALKFIKNQLSGKTLLIALFSMLFKY